MKTYRVILISLFLCILLSIGQKDKAEQVNLEVDKIEQKAKYESIKVSKQTVKAKSFVKYSKLATVDLIEKSDLIGWIYVEGTQIDYPVYTNEKENYYLHHDSKGNESSRGCIYTNNPNARTLVLFGHAMNDGTMFGELFCCYVGKEIEYNEQTYAVKSCEDVTVENFWQYINNLDDGIALVCCHGQDRFVVFAQ